MSRPGRQSRTHRGTRAGRRIQQRRYRTITTRPYQRDGAITSPDRHPGPLSVSTADHQPETRCLLRPPRLSAGQTHQLQQQMSTVGRHYSIGHINARSLAPRLNDVCYLLESERLETLCISET